MKSLHKLLGFFGLAALMSSNSKLTDSKPEVDTKRLHQQSQPIYFSRYSNPIFIPRRKKFRRSGFAS